MKIPFLKRIDRYLIAKFLGTYFFSIILIQILEAFIITLLPVLH